MSNKKQFGVWMDNHHATIVGTTEGNETTFTLIAHVKNETSTSNSNEKSANNHEKTVQAKYFKEIAAHMQNATNVHVTGTGVAQEQFIHYLADTPQFKNTQADESTSNKMSDENLLAYISEKFA